MRKRFATWSFSILFIAIGLIQPTSVAQPQPKQGTWNQPYIPTKLDWLLLKLSTKKEICISQNDNKGINLWNSWGQWSKANEESLKLVVDSYAHPDCAFLLLSKLGTLSSDFSLAPPIVKLHLTQIDKRGQWSGQI
jgi:hypothetical protein